MQYDSSVMSGSKVYTANHHDLNNRIMFDRLKKDFADYFKND